MQNTTSRVRQVTYPARNNLPDATRIWNRRQCGPQQPGCGDAGGGTVATSTQGAAGGKDEDPGGPQPAAGGAAHTATTPARGER